MHQVRRYIVLIYILACNFSLPCHAPQSDSQVALWLHAVRSFICLLLYPLFLSFCIWFFINNVMVLSHIEPTDIVLSVAALCGLTYMYVQE